MKTTTTLKTLTLAAATGLFAGVAYLPVLKAAEWRPSTNATVNTLMQPDYVAIDGVNVTVTTSGKLYSNSTIDIGWNNSGAAGSGSLTVNGDGYVMADGLGVWGTGELVVCDNGTVSLANYNLDISGGNARVKVIGPNASILVGHISSTEPGIINLENGELLIDGGNVTANEIGYAGGHLKIYNGGWFKAYSDDTDAAINMSNLTVTLGLRTDYAWQPSIVISKDITVNGLPQLGIDAGGVFFGTGTLFTIIEAVEGVDYTAIGATIEDPTTHQLFTVGGNGYNITLTAQAVPEPSTYALLGGVGAVALAVLSRRRRRG